MCNLVLAKGNNLISQFRISSAEIFGLLSVVLVDDLLDRDGARHSGALAQERRRGTEGITGNCPQWVEGRRTRPPHDQQLVEPAEMAFLGLCHPADLAGAAAASEHVELTFINPRRAVLAGVVDPQHARDLLGWIAISGQALWVRFAHAIPRRIPPRREGRRSREKAARQLPPITKEASRFHPASEMPQIDQAGSSQRTGIWPRMRAFSASTVSAAVAAPVQALGPANQ